MSVNDLAGHLRPACEEVLETMFFTSVMQDAEPSPELLCGAGLRFSGSPSGSFQVRTSTVAAPGLAAGFLGDAESDITAERAGEVVCELANMLCGSVLSCMDRAAIFELSQPER